jgi:hypothetical protein
MGGGQWRQLPCRNKTEAKKKKKPQTKTKMLGKEMKQNEIGEGRNSKPRQRSVGKTKNRSKCRPILHQIRPEGAKSLQKGQPGGKIEANRRKN